MVWGDCQVLGLTYGQGLCDQFSRRGVLLIHDNDRSVRGSFPVWSVFGKVCMLSTAKNAKPPLFRNGGT